MTAKELRDVKVECRKMHFLLEATNHLLMAREMEIAKSVEKSMQNLEVTSKAFSKWRKIFNMYNSNNEPKLSMGRMPCWDKVLDWAIENKKVDE